MALPAAGAATMAGVKFEPRETVRLGLVGTGGRGSGLLGMFSLLPGVQITALCDIVPEKTRATAASLERAGKPRPELYHGSEHAFERMVTRDDIDLLLVATTWKWHAPVALAGMRAGKHVGVEVRWRRRWRSARNW